MGDSLAGQRPSQTLVQPLPARSITVLPTPRSSLCVALYRRVSLTCDDTVGWDRVANTRHAVDRVEIIDDETITYGSPQVMTGRMEMFVVTPLR